MNVQKKVAPQMFSNIFEELKKVTWPTRKQTIHLTLVVFVISFIVGAYVGALDFILAKALNIITSNL